jgi:electron transfer flavoprotein beta subunit
VKILVPCKRVPDTDQKIRVLPDSSGIDHSNLSYLVNPFDAIALEESLRIREATDEVQVVAVSIGPPECEKQLRTCLAMGADRGILVDCDLSLDPWNVASILVQIVKRESPDLVLMGKQAVDDDANQTGQFLAARLSWPQATFASRLQLDGRSARIARETDAGIETIRVNLPAVVTADLRLNEPRYASLPSIMKARKKPIETIALQDLGVAMEPRVKVLKMEIGRAHV